MEYSWPGNARELKSALEYAFVSCKNSMIIPEDLPRNIVGQENQENIERLFKAKSDHGPEADSHLKDINEIKKGRLMDALKRSGGNQSEAARILGISRTSVWSQIKRYDIDLSKM
jgi:two-component system, NtrC family, response regulator HydG